MKLQDVTITLRNWEVIRSTYFGNFQRDHRFQIGQQADDPNEYSIVVTLRWHHGESAGQPVAAYIERLVSRHLPNDVAAVWERVDGYPLSHILMP